MLAFGIHRPMQRKDFSTEERRLLELVVPHLWRAAQTHVRLAESNTQREVSASILSTMSVAVIVVESNGLLVVANPAAERLLQEGDGLLVHSGRVTTRDPRQEASFLRCIHNASLVAAGDIQRPSNVL